MNNITNHEIYQYCLDPLPMLFALGIPKIVHTGRTTSDKERENPGRKERKARKVVKNPNAGKGKEKCRPISHLLGVGFDDGFKDGKIKRYHWKYIYSIIPRITSHHTNCIQKHIA